MTEEYDYMDAKTFLQAAIEGFEEHNEVDDDAWNICDHAASTWSGLFGQKINPDKAALGIAALEMIRFKEDPEQKHHAVNALMYTALAVQMTSLSYYMVVETIREKEAEEAQEQKSQQQRSEFSIVWEEAKKSTNKAGGADHD